MKTHGAFVVSKIVAGCALMLSTSGLFAGSYVNSHNYVNTTRSGVVSHVFVSQSIDGEGGKMTLSGYRPAKSDFALATASSEDKVESWQGFGISSRVGIELMKFVQFSAGHTFVKLRSQSDSNNNLDGSRLSGAINLVFQAPLVNLEVGGGVLASNLEMQRQLERSNLMGSGMFYSLGVNYFITSQISSFFHVKTINENLSLSGGADVVKGMKNDATGIGAGFSIWL